MKMKKLMGKIGDFEENLWLPIFYGGGIFLYVYAMLDCASIQYIICSLLLMFSLIVNVCLVEEKIDERKITKKQRAKRIAEQRKIERARRDAFRIDWQK